MQEAWCSTHKADKARKSAPEVHLYVASLIAVMNCSCNIMQVYSIGVTIQLQDDKSWGQEDTDSMEQLLSLGPPFLSYEAESRGQDCQLRLEANIVQWKQGRREASRILDWTVSLVFSNKTRRAEIINICTLAGRCTALGWCDAN